MKSKVSFLYALALVTFSLASIGNSTAQTWLEVESTYLGDGSFHYRIGSRSSPIIKDLLVGGFGVTFTNTIQLAPSPAGWTNNVGAVFPNWTAEDSYSYWQVRPYDAGFELRSSLTNYTIGAGTVIMRLTMYEFIEYSPHVSMDIVGYWNAPVLVPSPIASDPVLPSTLYTNQSFEDVKIGEFVRNGDAILGIAFQANYAATYQLEASSDMSIWNPVIYLHSQVGRTVWTNAIDIRQWGSFFRLNYVEYGHVPFTDLPPLDPSQPFPAKALPRAPQKSLKPHITADADSFSVRVDSTPGQTYRVEVRENGRTVWQRDCKAGSHILEVKIPRHDLPPSGFILTRELL
jgi:hypothetical protein